MTDDQQQKTLYEQLNENQKKFVTVLLENPTWSKAKAAEEIGVSAQTVYRWPKLVDDALDAAREAIYDSVLELRRNVLLKAMQVKVEALFSEDEAIRQKAATELIEWELGKAQQRSDLTSGGEALMTPVVYLPALDDDDSG